MSPSSLRPALRIDGTVRRPSPAKETPAGLVCARLNHIFASLQEFLGIDRTAVKADFVMQMGPSAAAGAAQHGNPGVHRYLFAARHQNAVEMGIERHDAVTVIDLDRSAVALLESREDHDPGSRAVDRRAVRRIEVNTGMEFRAVVEWIAPGAERAADIVADIERRAQR